MQENVIADFVSALLLEARVAQDGADYEHLHETLEGRVASRLLLELLMVVPAEEAALIRAEMEAGVAEPAALFEKMSKKIPDLPEQLLEILRQIRSELLEDLAELRTKDA